MKKLLFLLIPLCFIGCTKQINRLEGIDTSNDDKAQPYWIYPKPSGTIQQFCQDSPEECKRLGLQEASK